MAEGKEYQLGQLEADVRNLKEGQDRIEHRMDAGFADMKVCMGEKFDKYSRRIGALERWRAWLTGGLAILSLIYAAFIAWAFRK